MIPNIRIRLIYFLSKGGLVDVDIFLVKVIAKYRVITARTKLFVIHAFQAADLDGNKKINLNEFLTLYRHIEAIKYQFLYKQRFYGSSVSQEAHDQ